MVTASLGEIRGLARVRSDTVSDQHLLDSDINAMVNDSAKEFYDLLVQAGEGYMPCTTAGASITGSDPQGNVVPGAVYSITTSAGVSSYALPSDFYHLRGVDASPDGLRWMTVKRYQFGDRNIYSFLPLPVGMNPGPYGLRYDIDGDYVTFIPGQNLPANLKIRLRYYPTLPLLVNDSDVMNVAGGMRDYVVVDTAIKIKDIQESDTTVLLGQKEHLTARVRALIRDRDKSTPHRVLSPFRRGGPRGGRY